MSVTIGYLRNSAQFIRATSAKYWQEKGEYNVWGANECLLKPRSRRPTDRAKPHWTRASRPIEATLAAFLILLFPVLKIAATAVLRLCHVISVSNFCSTQMLRKFTLAYLRVSFLYLSRAFLSPSNRIQNHIGEECVNTMETNINPNRMRHRFGRRLQISTFECVPISVFFSSISISSSERFLEADSFHSIPNEDRNNSLE